MDLVINLANIRNNTKDKDKEKEKDSSSNTPKLPPIISPTKKC